MFYQFASLVSLRLNFLSEIQAFSLNSFSNGKIHTLTSSSRLGFLRNAIIAKTVIPHLKKLILILFILLLTQSSRAQIKGTIYQDDFVYPLAKVYFNESKLEAESDYDGNFELKISKSIIDKSLIFEYEGIVIWINNCSFKENEIIDMGKIVLPGLKMISVSDYEQLDRKKRKYCKPLFDHSGIIMSYEMKNELSNEFLILSCGEKIQITDYTFNKKKIRIDLEYIKLFN